MAGHRHGSDRPLDDNAEEGFLVKDLDSGRYVSLEELQHLQQKRGSSAAMEDLGEEDSAQTELNTASGSSSKSWSFKGARRKMAKMAKKTLTAIQERVDEGKHRSPDNMSPQGIPSRHPLADSAYEQSTTPTRSAPDIPAYSNAGHTVAPATLGPLAARLKQSGPLQPAAAVSVTPLNLQAVSNKQPVSSQDSTSGTYQQPVMHTQPTHSGEQFSASGQRPQSQGSFISNRSGHHPNLSITVEEDDTSSQQSMPLSTTSTTLQEGFDTASMDNASIDSRGKSGSSARAALKKTLKWGKSKTEQLVEQIRRSKDSSSAQLPSPNNDEMFVEQARNSAPNFLLGQPEDTQSDTWSGNAQEPGHDRGFASVDQLGISAATTSSQTGKPSKGGALRGKLRSLVQSMGSNTSKGSRSGKGYKAVPGQDAYLGTQSVGLDEGDEGEGEEDSIAGGAPESLPDDAGDESTLLIPKASMQTGLGQPARTQAARGTPANSRLLSTVRLIQSIPAHDGIVWIARFNTHGSLLATGGQDGVTRVWAVCSHSGHHNPATAAPAKVMQSVPLATQPRTHTMAYTIKPSAADASDEEEATEINRTSAPALQSVPSVPLTVDNAQSGPPSLGAQSTAPTWLLNAETQPGQSQPSWGPPVLQSTPLYLLHGHTDDVLDLAWSAGNFLLTASVDGLVKLWHVPPPSSAAAYGLQPPTNSSGSPAAGQLLSCMQEYTHPDFVTCVAFHPHDASLFVSGCADGRLRVWDTLQARVVASAVTPHDMVTCVTWLADGSRIVVGTLQGRCRQYALQVTGGPASTANQTGGQQAGGSSNKTYKLEYLATIDVKDKRASAGRKLTSVVAVPGRPGSFLTASNDSRLRLYSRYSLPQCTVYEQRIMCVVGATLDQQEVKFKGCRNTNTLVKAALDEAGRHIVCGSDNGWVYVWDAQGAAPGQGGTACEPRKGQAPGMQGASSHPTTGAHHNAAMQNLVNAAQGLRSKNPYYDAFFTNETTVTTAQIAPRAAWRQQPGSGTHITGAGGGHMAISFSTNTTLISTTANDGSTGKSRPQSAAVNDGSKHSQGSAATGRMENVGMADIPGMVHAAPATPAVTTALYGAVFVVAGFKGQLLVYENV